MILSLFNLQRHFYFFFLSLLPIFLLLKVLLEIMHPEFAVVFLSPISYVRLSNRYTFVKIIFFSLASLGAVLFLAHV